MTDVMKIIDKLFPCDSKVKAIIAANKNARDELIVEMRKNTDMTIEAIKEIANDIKGA